jgi:hypothetical protein
MESDPHCATLHPEGVPSEDLVVDRERRVRWAFVYLRRAPLVTAWDDPPAPEIVQKDCRFDPRVLGMVAGSRLLVRNGDPFLHNVHFLPFVNPERNCAQARKDDEHAFVFHAPELMIPLKCDVHPWMKAWIGVLDHPYFAVTGETGGYTIGGIPDGLHEVVVWHEELAGEVREVLVVGGEARADFVLSLRR